jgi:hypothetical protein
MMKKILTILVALFLVSNEAHSQISATITGGYPVFDTHFFYQDTMPDRENYFYSSLYATVNYEIMEQIFITVGGGHDNTQRFTKYHEDPTGYNHSFSYDLDKTSTSFQLGAKILLYGYEPLYEDDSAAMNKPFVPLDSLIRPYIGFNFSSHTITQKYDHNYWNTGSGYRHNVNFETTQNTWGATIFGGALIKLTKVVSLDLSASATYTSPYEFVYWSNPYLRVDDFQQQDIWVSMNVGISIGL